MIATRAHGGSTTEHGPDAIAGLASSRATNEDCYAMARLMRAAIGTNNIDNCSRVCHSPTSFALRTVVRPVGRDRLVRRTSTRADAAIIIGANPTEGHPVVGARIKQAALRGLQARHDRPPADRAGRLRRAAPRAAAGHERRRACSGSRMSSRRDGLLDERFIAARTEGCEARSRAARAVHAASGPGDHAASRAADLEHAAHIYARGRRTRRIIWGLGVTEHKYGSEVVQLICNLAMMTGKVGRRGSALLPLRGQNNVQGSSDMGALPDTYTAYRSVGDEEAAQSFEAAWGVAALACARGTRSRRCSTPRSPAAEGDVHLR